MLRSGLI